MNWHEHIGKFLAGFGGVSGVSFVYLFQGMIRDTWNVFLSWFRQFITAKPAAAVPLLNGASKLGDDLAHQLVNEMLGQWKEYKEEEGKRWKIISEMVETLRGQALNIAAIDTKYGQQQEILKIIAARGNS